jgi:hypothetical protein
MASDQQVDAKLVLQSLMELQRQGPDSVLRHLESTEPDLAEYVLEQLTEVHRRLLDLGGDPRKARRLHRRIQALVLVPLMALRKGHYRLWHESQGGGSTGLRPASEPPTPPDASPPSAS